MFHQDCPLCKQPACPGLPETLTLTFSGLTDSFDSGPLLRSTVGRISFYPTAPITDSTGPLSGFKAVEAGSGLARLGRVAPQVRVVNNTGFDAAFSVSVRPITIFGEQFWELDQVSIASSGHGYVHDSQMLFLVSDGDVCASSPSVLLKVARGAPSLIALTVPPSRCTCAEPNARDGIGAELLVTVSQASFTAGQESWAVSGVTVLRGGNGYLSGQQLHFVTGPSDIAVTAASATILVDDQGAITGVTIQSGGAYYKAGVPISVSILDRGRLYREDPSAAVVVDGLTGLPAVVDNATPNGLVLDGAVPAAVNNRATFDVTVDQNKDSSTFGDSLSISLATGGSGYRAGKTKSTCLSLLNGQPIVLKASRGEDAVYACLQSKYGFLLRPFAAPEGYDGKETGLTTPPFSTNDFAFAYRGRVQPSVAVSSFSQDTLGATWSVQWEPITLQSGLPAYAIARVTAAGGSLIFDQTQLFAAPATQDDKVAIAAEMTVYKHRLPPELSASTPCHQGQAVFEIEYKLLEAGPPVYGVALVKVLSGGQGYSGRVPISFTAAAGTNQDAAACAVAFANESGQLESVQVHSAGRFWKSEDRPGFVAITNPGAYYRERTDLPPIYDADAVVQILQRDPSNGSGAAVDFTVNLDPLSPSFGKLSSVSMASSGSGYVLRAAAAAYRGTCELTGALPITCEVNFGSNCALEVSLLARGDVAQVMPLTGAANAYGFFADQLGSQQVLSLSNQQITLPAFLPTNAATCLVEWGGVFDEDSQVCSCCDFSTEYCGQPPESGWPLSGGASPATFIDPFGVVWIKTCAGLNADGVFVSPNGGWIEWTAVYDDQGNFVEWQRLCGECDEQIIVGVDPDTFEYIYSSFPEPAQSPAVRGNNGVTRCACFRFDESRGCIFGPEIGGDGCWTGGYVVETISCDNPLP